MVATHQPGQSEVLTSLRHARGLQRERMTGAGVAASDSRRPVREVVRCAEESAPTTALGSGQPKE
jgi:hypothetical protein